MCGAPWGGDFSAAPTHSGWGHGAGESRDPSAAVGALRGRHHAPGPCVLGWGDCGLGASVRSEPPSTAGLEGGGRGSQSLRLLSASVHSEPVSSEPLSTAGQGCGLGACVHLGLRLQAPCQWIQPGFPSHFLRRPVSGRSATCWWVPIVSDHRCTLLPSKDEELPRCGAGGCPVPAIFLGFLDFPKAT